MKPGIVLVHGYTGSPLNLQPLADELVKIYGDDSIKNITLPGHNRSEVPPFDEKSFTEHISKEISSYKDQDRKTIVIGHSTGGNMAIACIREKGIVPDYLILAGVPFQIDSGAYNRWSEHRKGDSPVPFTDVARMVSLINRTGKYGYIEDFHTLILNGEDDRLVLPSDACKWKEKFPANKARLVLAPGVDHDMFNSRKTPFIIDVILRAVEDVTENNSDDLSILAAAEPEVQDFLKAFPLSAKYLARCPGSRLMIDSHFEPETFPVNEPVFANIEITTKCNFHCKYCARCGSGNNGINMDKAIFRRILDLLPHAYRITLVGLGEPLMHPELIDFIETASSLKRRVGIVTNASLLDASLSRKLVSAGLHSIAFSLDTVNQDTASIVRKGTDVEKVIENIRRFIETADAARPISKAVFTALSIENIQYFNELVDVVSELGVDILMVTDLNFMENVNKTIWKNADDEMISGFRETVKKAFVKKLPVLSVHALEEFGLRSRYRDFLLLPPDQLSHRSLKRKFCFSPWQTVPVNVKGDITMCDCQPENRVGNILNDPFSEIWNGELMKNYRERMLSDDPPGACRICPRF